jgi:hypothetical protein
VKDQVRGVNMTRWSCPSRWRPSPALGRGDGVAVSVLVTPPALLGRDLPEVRAATPEVALDTDRS